jgi:NADPH:quinone reductase
MIPQQMRGITVTGPGGPEVMRYSPLPTPVPRAHEVLIKVAAAGVNRPDLMQRAGTYPPPADASPIMGLEVAGEVVAVGADVTSQAVGAKVTALVNGGGYAEYCVAPAVQCLRWPKGLDAIQAASLPETCFTVWANLFEHGRLARGESVLIHGGTSGIGVTAIQLAREFGATVFTTAGSAIKCQACEQLGVAAAINYKAADFVTEINTLTQGNGVNVIIDIVGAAYFLKNLSLLAMDGRLVQVAVQSGGRVDGFEIFKVMQKRLVITGSTLRPRTTAEKGRIAEALASRVWPLIDAGRFKPIIDRVFDLANASEAHSYLDSGTHIGKVILKVTD